MTNAGSFHWWEYKCSLCGERLGARWRGTQRDAELDAINVLRRHEPVCGKPGELLARAAQVNA